MGIEAAAISAVVAVLGLGLALFSRALYDHIIPNAATESLVALSAGVLIAVIADGVLRTVRALLLEKAAVTYDTRLSARLFGRIVGARLDLRPSSHRLATVLDDFEAVRGAYASATITAAVDSVCALVFLLLLAWFTGWLALVPVMAGLPGLLVAHLARGRINVVASEASRVSSARRSLLTETVQGLEDVRLLGAEATVTQRMARISRDHARHGARLRVLGALAMLAPSVMSQASSLAVSAVGAAMVMGGSIGMGDLVAASILAGRVAAPFLSLAGAAVAFGRARAASEALATVLDLHQERGEGLQLSIAGGIEARQVDFSYLGAKIPTLAGISLTLAPGEHLALVGPSGAGKTSLLRVLAGLHAPTSGMVLVDGRDMTQVAPGALRVAIGAVTQAPMLFTGTLRENLLLAAPGASDDQLLAAADLAGVSPWANAHPAGFEMAISERGENLSGGQRQAVALARLFLADPRVVLLDEPTAHMDPATEAAFIDRLASWSAGRTLIVATHRTPILRLVERVAVVQGGRIAATMPAAEAMRRVAA